MKKPPLAAADDFMEFVNGGPTPLPSGDLWSVMHSADKVACLVNAISRARSSLFQALHEEGQQAVSCRHRIAFLNAQIKVFDDIQDSMKPADVDNLARWMFANSRSH